MKYKSLSLLIIVLFSACTIGAQNRKKVGIVLSGGGAKGVAHIGALKVIEEAGIPIDYVVGTSMGAIVGGLYSIGYTPQQLDSIVNAQDWKYLLSDALDPETTLLSEKLREEQYHAIEINRGEYSRNGHTGAHGSCQNTVVENDFAAIHDVVRYTGEWNRHPVERNGVVISHCQFGK